MGRMKEEMLRMEGLHDLARSIAIKGGAISECPLHSYITIDNDDSDGLTTAYKIGAAMVRDGEVDCGHRELMDAIKRAKDESAWDCPVCSDHAED